jgi:hypothetical protein
MTPLVAPLMACRTSSGAFDLKYALISPSNGAFMTSPLLVDMAI